MKIAVRADAGIAMGIGHVMRCLTLLDQLGKMVADLDVLFVCRDHCGHLAETIAERGYCVRLLPANETVCTNDALNQHARWLGDFASCDAEQTAHAIQEYFGSMIDWLVVDHYGIDAGWHRQLRTQTERLMVIDDLADRQYDCDLLLDQTYALEDSLYLPQVNKNCRVLLGTRFALLRDEFQRANKCAELLRNKRFKQPNLLITLGGGDPENITGDVIEALVECRDLFARVTVVLGHANPHMDALRANYQSFNVTLLQAVNNMALLMREHDVAIGAAGSTSWERCAMGLPTVSVVTADNQKTIASKLQIAGAVKVIPVPITSSALIDAIMPWLKDYSAYMRSVRACKDICDGRGAARVCRELLAL